MYHTYSTDIHIENFTRQPNDQQCILQEKCLAIAEEEREGLIWLGPSVALLARYPSVSFLIRASYCEMGRAGENGQYISPHNIAHCQQRNIFISQNWAFG